ncbi:MAG: hypothetical protein M1814_004212 [Vezdaea aestivalis]|nr:MAG: hypothetical protein M1814_004212 [Vezdaea aestivalis]
MMPFLQFLTGYWLNISNLDFSLPLGKRPRGFMVFNLFLSLVAIAFHYRLTDNGFYGVVGIVCFTLGDMLWIKARDSIHDHAIPDDFLTLSFCALVSLHGTALSGLLCWATESLGPSWTMAIERVITALSVSSMCISWVIYGIMSPHGAPDNSSWPPSSMPSLLNRMTSLDSTLTLLAVNLAVLLAESLVFGVPVIAALQYAAFSTALAISFFYDPELPDLPQRYKWLAQTLFRAAFIAIIAAACFGTTTMSFFCTSHSSDLKLDSGYQTNIDFSIVIAHQEGSVPELVDFIKEIIKIPSIEPLSRKLHIYSKSNTTIDSDEYTLIDPLFKALDISNLDHRGLESHTYLHHIEHTWYSVATHTLFLPGIPSRPGDLVSRLSSYFTPRQPGKTGFLSLGSPGSIVPCARPFDTEWVDSWHMVDAVSRALDPDNRPCDTALLSYGSAFVASAARIRGTNREVFTQLYNLLNSASINSSAHIRKKIAESGALGKDSVERPVVERSVERVWSLVMQCNEKRIAERCPSLLSGTRIGGEKEDCACLDD